MKRIFLLVGLLVFVVAMHSFREANRKFASILSQLGVNEEDGKTYIWTSFIYGNFQYPSNKTIKSLTIPKRAEVARDLAAYAKKYLLSSEFKKIYNERREVARPKIDEKLKPEVAMKAVADDTRKQLAEWEEYLKTADAKMKPEAEKTVATFKAQLKSYTDPTDKNYVNNLKSAQFVYDAALAQNKPEMEKFNKLWPENPVDIVRDRLQRFLDISNEVDFNAELKEGYGGKKVFVKPEYERKSKDWKACYRAGKETIDVVREEVSKFLKELK